MNTTCEIDNEEDIPFFKKVSQSNLNVKNISPILNIALARYDQTGFRETFFVSS